jgi:threonine synthase
MRVPPVISGSALSHLSCVRCDQRHAPDEPRNVCPTCGGPLFARYDLARADLRALPWDLPQRPNDIWRYAELLPVRSGRFRIGLGEGMTPMLAVPRLAEAIGLTRLWIKDEGRSPTGSFKSRGMAIAVARAAELHIESLVAPSAGNAGLAMAAYAARHGLRALVAFPEDIPPAYVSESESYGAEVIVAGATIREAGQALRDHVKQKPDWRDAFDLSTLREPYRLEGKKTMGYEIAEQLSGGIPDAVLYPTGGGTGLIGIAKAFDEMAALGWTDEHQRPRMIAVQMGGCDPIVEAHAAGADHAIAKEDAVTRCWGLRVPAPFADREILKTLRRTHGTAIAVDEDELEPASQQVRRCEGIDLAPEGAAAVAAIPHLLRSGSLRKTDRIVVLNTAASGMYK